MLTLFQLFSFGFNGKDESKDGFTQPEGGLAHRQWVVQDFVCLEKEW